MLVGTCNLSTNKSKRNTPYIVDTILKDTTYGICDPPMNLSEEAVLRQSLIQVTVSNVREPLTVMSHIHMVGITIDYNHQNQSSLIRRWNHHQQQQQEPPFMLVSRNEPNRPYEAVASVSRTRWNPLFDTATTNSQQ